jgi:hypothetical protein
MRDYQTKANAGGAPDSITSTKLGAGETNSFLTEAKTAVSRAGLTPADADGAGEDTTQLAQALFINAVKASSFLDSGSANAYQLTPISGSSGVLLPGGYGALNGMRIYFVPSANNTGNTTINIGQTVGTLLGSKKALTLAGGEIPSGALLASRLAAFTYDASADGGNGAWILDGSYDASGQFLPLAGGTMTGPIAMGSNKITGLADGTATGDAVHKGQLDLKAPLESPALTGTPTAPTAAVATDTTQVATTAHVKLTGIGWGQTWQNVSGSRVANTWYTNSTGKPIQLAISAGLTNTQYFQISPDGGTTPINVLRGLGGTAGSPSLPTQLVIPNGWSYRVPSGATIDTWWELR